MRSGQGDGYTLVAFDSANGIVLGPGAAFVFDGVWHIDGRQVLGGEGVEIMWPTTFNGNGLIAVVTYKPETPPPVPESAIVKQVVVKHEKPWGWELEVPTLAQQVQLKLIHVADGHRTSEQYHEHKDEVMMHIPDCCPRLERVRPKQVHRVAGPHTYFEASTYHPDDVVRTADDYGRSL